MVSVARGMRLVFVMCFFGLGWDGMAGAVEFSIIFQVRVRA